MVRTFVVVLSLLGLGALNVLTLVNGQIHDAGYGAIRAILGSAVSDEVLSRIFRNSPTATRRKDIAAATRVLLDEKSILSASNKSLLVKRAVLEKLQQETSAKNAELTRTSVTRAATVSKFSKRLATRSVINATRNLSSVPGEAIPIAGVAIVIGVTAWDLYDACETLKDLNELNSAFGHSQEDSTKVCGMKVPTKDQAMAQIKGKWKATYRDAAESLNKGGIATVPPPESE